MFDYLGENFYIYDTVFKEDPVITFSIFKVEKTKIPKMIYPYGHTSSGKNRIELLGKLYNEYLERFKMVNNDRVEGSTNLIDLKDLSRKKETRTILSYNIDNDYGLKDTTGTASGLNSKFLIEKAVLELLEKNELIPMWYKKYCKKVEVKNEVKKLIINYGLQTKEVKILYGKNISNAHTVMLMIFDKDNNIRGSGSACDKNSIKALQSAVEEAIMQRLVNGKSPFFTNLNENPCFYKYFKNLYKSVPLINLENLQAINEIKIKSNFNDVQIGLLNINNMQREITVKALSKKMFNCVPTISNIEENKSKYILKYFNINKKIDKLIQCPII